MNLKLACSDFTFPLLPFEAVLDLIHALDIPAVDLGVFEGTDHLNASIELADPEASGARLKAKLDAHGLTLADIFIVAALDRETIAPNNPDPADNRRSREFFERGLDYISASGGDHLTQLPGVNFEGESVEDNFNRAAEELAWRSQRAADRGIVFKVEPHLGSVIETPELAIRMAEVAPGLTYALDYAHFTMAGYPDSAVEPLLRHASHFHVRGACEGYLQAQFDKNTIDFRHILVVMNDQGYKGHQCLEYVWIEWEHCNECDNLSESIRFRDFLRTAAAEI
jgi:sugar phosphate isomerase/epimerase